MQVNPKILKQKFEKSMPKYNDNAVVQREMALTLVELIIKNLGCDFKRILELGSGTGLLTEVIAEKLKFQNITCNDIVEKSKIYLDKILKEYIFLVGNSTKIKPCGYFDLIVSNAMFQWHSDLSKALEKYCRFLDKNGIIAFSTFSTNNFKEIKDALGLSLKYLSLEDILTVLSQKFEILEIVEEEKVLDFSSPLELLAHLKNTGVNSLSSKKMTFTEVKNFCDAIQNDNGKVTLTYAPVFVVARKK